MFWANFLHIYQPCDQSDEILEKVVNESYRPLFKGFLNIPKMKINININGALTELLIKKGYRDVIDIIRQLAESGRLEFTESAKYHPLLNSLNKNEIIRQIIKNHQTNKKYFGKAYQPKCFFPPEMAYDSKVGKIVYQLNYPLIMLDEISYTGGKIYPPKDRLFGLKIVKNLTIIFRERKISNSIMSSVVRNKKDFFEILGEDLRKKQYLCTAMDGETFGHHRPGLEKFLFKIVSLNNPKQIFLSEIPKYFKVEKKIIPLAATWASSQWDIEKGFQFYSWRNPKNKVHKLQWRLFNYVRKLAKTEILSEITQEKLDRALASDQFFWASGEPWWSVEMIEKGARALLDVLNFFPNIKKEEIEKGRRYYRDILSVAFWWQRSGKIGAMARKYKEGVKIPFKERTLEKGEPEKYFAFLNLMKEEMWKAAKKKNFEKAILWRDAIWKIETKNDIYETMHAEDILRKEIPDPVLRKAVERYKNKYKKIKSGQPELRKI